VLFYFENFGKKVFMGAKRKKTTELELFEYVDLETYFYEFLFSGILFSFQSELNFQETE
jgi:hypothetical protein